MLRLIDSGRIEMGIVDKQIALYLIKKEQLQIDIGQVHEAVERPLRLHKKHEEALPAINRAIGQLKKQNAIKDIIYKHLSSAPL